MKVRGKINEGLEKQKEKSIRISGHFADTTVNKPLVSSSAEKEGKDTSY